MNKVSLYLEANQLQKSNTQQLLQQFKSVLKWRSDGNDSILDAGCGPGDVTIDSLLSILPTKFDRLVGVDISKEMIDYARETKTHPKVSFEQFDLEVELEKQPLNGIAPFDHITSFFCLMMIQNQRTCIQNFYKLLKPEGDMLLVFLAGHPLYDIYKILSRKNRWAEYMTDVDQKISPYHYSEQPAEEFQNLLSDCGFKICDVEVHHKEHIFDNDEQLKNFVHATTRFIDRIPSEHKQAFLEDIVLQFVEKGHALDDFHKDRKACRIRDPYRLIVAYARK